MGMTFGESWEDAFDAAAPTATWEEKKEEEGAVGGRGSTARHVVPFLFLFLFPRSKHDRRSRRKRNPLNVMPMPVPMPLPNKQMRGSPTSDSSHDQKSEVPTNTQQIAKIPQPTQLNQIRIQHQIIVA